MTQHLNLKWSVRDVDAIIWLAGSRNNADEICRRFGRGLTTEDVERICREEGLYLYRRTQEAGK